MLFSLATLTFNGVSIITRDSDGFVNLGLMAKANGKRLDNWLRTKDTQMFLEQLTTQDFTPIKSSSIKNHPDFGTWGDPKVALKLATWISKPFEKMVYEWIENLLTDGYVQSPLATQQQLENAAISATVKLVEEDRIANVIEVAIKQYSFIAGKDYHILTGGGVEFEAKYWGGIFHERWGLPLMPFNKILVKESENDILMDYLETHKPRIFKDIVENGQFSPEAGEYLAGYFKENLERFAAEQSKK
jgi:hypothetical protein